MIRTIVRKGSGNINTNVENSIQTLLVDGNALFKTGYHGAKNEYNFKGEHIGGIYQFITVLRKLLNEKFYHKVFVFWDGAFSGKLRYNIYRDYKSDRGKNYETGTIPDDPEQLIQRYIVQEYLEELFIKQLEDPVVESDDFIAYYVKHKEPNEHITICTNDSDLCQLVSENVRAYLCNKKIFLTYENYSDIFTHKQENAKLIKIISGDTADSIKGIVGIKEPTLLKHFPELISEVVSLDFIIAKSIMIQENRLKVKQKPLKALDNIINRVTDGIQGDLVYEINTLLVDLDNPMMTDEAIHNLEVIKQSSLSVDDRGIKNIYKLFKRDGLDSKIGDNYEEYVLPFKKLIEREKKFKYE